MAWEMVWFSQQYNSVSHLHVRPADHSPDDLASSTSGPMSTSRATYAPGLGTLTNLSLEIQWLVWQHWEAAAEAVEGLGGGLLLLMRLLRLGVLRAAGGGGPLSVVVAEWDWEVEAAVVLGEVSGSYWAMIEVKWGFDEFGIACPGGVHTLW